MTILLAGGSGLLGTELARSLIADGHVVRRLVRRPARRADEIEWHPERHDVPASALAGVSAVVCLSGVGLGDHRWTQSYKRAIRSSRLDPVSTLAGAIASGDHRPSLICASAIGYYGDTGERVVDESAPSGAGFVAELCSDWEAAAEPARQAGARVVHLRTGVVLSPHGGLLGRLRPIMRMGVGGRLGTGRQFVAWISLADTVAAIAVLMDSDLDGPVNLTAPNPVRNSELVDGIARLVKRPAVIPVPKFALRLVVGGLAGEALGGQRALPARLSAGQFEFRYPTLHEALRAALGEEPA
jgi:uncharacterized protein (TIGR01777 family)